MSTTEPAWFKSSYSSAQGDNCVEVAASPTTIHVRDSTRPTGPALALTPSSWAPFIAQAGDFGPDVP